MRGPLGAAEFAIVLGIVILLFGVMFGPKRPKQLANEFAQALQEWQLYLRGNRLRRHDYLRWNRRWRHDPLPPVDLTGITILAILLIVLLVEMDWLSTLL